MIILYDATIDCPGELRPVYEWAFGDFERDDDDNFVLDDRQLKTPINRIRFPLPHTTITQFGSRIVISVPRPSGDFRIDELSKATATRASKGSKEIYTLNGLSDRLLRQNVDLEEAAVTFTVTRWSAQHLPNQKLEHLSDGVDVAAVNKAAGRRR